MSETTENSMTDSRNRASSSIKLHQGFNSLFLALSLLGALLYLPNLGIADSRTISGLQFEVESIVPVDDNSSKVTALGETRILAKSEVDEFIAAKFFEALPNKFDVSSVQAFTLDSLINGRARLAQIGLKQFLSLNPKDTESEFVSKFMEQTGSLNIAKGALENIRESMPAGPVTSRLVFEIAQRDPEWVRSILTKFVFIAATDLKDIEEENFRAALKANNLETARKLTELTEKLYGPQDSLYQKFSLCLSRLQDWVKLVEQDQLERLYPALQATWHDKNIGELLSPYLVTVLNREAQKRIGAGKFQNAITILSHIDFTRRTETTHDLVIDALGKLNGQETEILKDDGVRRFLELVSLKDARIKETYLRCIDRAADWGAARSDPGFIGVVLTQAISLRSDPNRQNDRMWLIQAELYYHLGMSGAAERAGADIQTFIGPIHRLKLLFYGYYGDIVIMLCMFGVVVIGLIFYLHRKRFVDRPVKAKPIDMNISGATTRSINEATEEVRRQFVGMTSRVKDQHHQEYEKCLARFGLQRDASEKMIKSAYRNAVKGVHPDMASDDTTHNPDQFIQLTDVYERIMVLRKELGIVDEAK